MRLSPSLAISVGVHVLLAGAWWVVDDPAPPPVELETVGPKIELEPVEEPVVEVVMLAPSELARIAPAPAATPAPAPAPARATPRRTAIAAATTVRPEVAVTPSTIDPEPRPRSSWMDLGKARRERASLRLSADALDRIASGPEVPPPSVVIDEHPGAIIDPKERESIVTAEITPGGRGGYKINDLVFKGRIERDGSVSIKDKANIQHQFTSWKHVKEVLRTAGPLGLLKLDFDVTDALMRKYKQDPYASRKLAFLDQTRDARVELGKEYRKDVLARTAEIVRENLGATWAAITDPAERKRALFEIWDEVDETGDEDLVEAGKAARLAVIGFIRGKLPRGADGAYTVDEIARFNSKRRSRATFAPYE